MVSSNGDSDIRLDRIQAREDQFHRDIRARRKSPIATKRVDPTELGCIGAHLDLSKHESWPNDLELTDSEIMSTSHVSTLRPLDTNTHQRPYLGSNAVSESPTSRACTPTKCSSYLPLHEFKELQRQRSDSSKFTYSLLQRVALRSISSYGADRSVDRRRVSVSTTVEPETQEEHDLNGRPQPHDTYFVSHTPSHCSRALTERDDRSVKSIAPDPPGPWSQLDPDIGKSRGGEGIGTLHG
jgi:hypothetical protein